MIQVHYMNTTPIEGFENISFQLISRQLGMPRPHNVLIPTILHAINLDFRNIYVVERIIHGCLKYSSRSQMKFFSVKNIIMTIKQKNKIIQSINLFLNQCITEQVMKNVNYTKY